MKTVRKFWKGIKNMKKTLAIVLILIMALSLLTACGGGESSTVSDKKGSSSRPKEVKLPDTLHNWNDFIGEINKQMKADNFAGEIPTKGEGVEWQDPVSGSVGEYIYKKGDSTWLWINYDEWGDILTQTASDFDLKIFVNEDGLVVSADNDSRGSSQCKDYAKFLLLAISSDITPEMAQAAIDEAFIPKPDDEETRANHYAEVGDYTFYYCPYFNNVGVFVTGIDKSMRRADPQ